MGPGGLESGPTPRLRVDRAAGQLRLQVTYAANSDSKRCPAHDGILRLFESIGAEQRGELTSIAAEGDRILSFMWRRPDLDRDELEVSVTILGVVGPCYHRATRLTTLRGAAAVILSPSPVAGYEDSARRVLSDLRDHADLDQACCAVQWATNSGRVEGDLDDLTSQFELEDYPRFVMDRRSGAGSQDACEFVLERALAAYDSGRWRPLAAE